MSVFFFPNLFLISKVSHEFLSLSCQVLSDSFSDVPASWWFAFPWSPLIPVTGLKPVASAIWPCRSRGPYENQRCRPAPLVPPLLPEWTRQGCSQKEIRLGYPSTHKSNHCSFLLGWPGNIMEWWSAQVLEMGRVSSNPNCHLQVMWHWLSYLINLGFRFFI